MFGALKRHGIPSAFLFDHFMYHGTPTRMLRVDKEIHVSDEVHTTFGSGLRDATTIQLLQKSNSTIRI
jgi:hypothetical protein